MLRRSGTPHHWQPAWRLGSGSRRPRLAPGWSDCRFKAVSGQGGSAARRRPRSGSGLGRPARRARAVPSRKLPRPSRSSGIADMAVCCRLLASGHPAQPGHAARLSARAARCRDGLPHRKRGNEDGSSPLQQHQLARPGDRLAAKWQAPDRDHDRQRYQSPERECRSLDHAALGGQHHDECGQRNGSNAIAKPVRTRSSTMSAPPSRLMEGALIMVASGSWQRGPIAGPPGCASDLQTPSRASSRPDRTAATKPW